MNLNTLSSCLTAGHAPSPPQLRHLRVAVWAIGAVLAVSPCLGHDPFETTTTARLGRAGLEVEITLARHGTKELLRRTAPGDPGLDASTPDSLQTWLGDRAGDLVEVRVADEALPLLGTQVSPGEDDGDVQLSLRFGLPPRPEFDFHFGFLTLLGEGFSGRLTFVDELSGYSRILAVDERRSTVEVVADARAGDEPFRLRPLTTDPGPADAPPQSPPAPDGAATNPGGEDDAGRMPAAYVLAAAMALALLLGLARSAIRRRFTRPSRP